MVLLFAPSGNKLEIINYQFQLFEAKMATSLAK
jgi:hypothetical protein